MVSPGGFVIPSARGCIIVIGCRRRRVLNLVVGGITVVRRLTDSHDRLADVGLHGYPLSCFETLCLRASCVGNNGCPPKQLYGVVVTGGTCHANVEIIYPLSSSRKIQPSRTEHTCIPSTRTTGHESRYKRHFRPPYSDLRPLSA